MRLFKRKIYYLVLTVFLVTVGLYLVKNTSKHLLETRYSGKKIIKPAFGISVQKIRREAVLFIFFVLYFFIQTMKMIGTSK